MLDSFQKACPLKSRELAFTLVIRKGNKKVEKINDYRSTDRRCDQPESDPKNDNAR